MQDKEVPRKYRFLPNSKWTAVKAFYGWRHYLVVDLDFDNRPFKALIQAVCDQKVLVWVEIAELQNTHNWLPGWKRLVQNPFNENP